jgi:hypothetical protein
MGQNDEAEEVNMMIREIYPEIDLRELTVI